MTGTTFTESRNGKWTAHRATKLLLRWRRDLSEGVLVGKLRWPYQIKAGTVEVVGTRLSNNVDDAASRAAVFGIETRSHYLKLSDCLLREVHRLGGTLTAAITPKERIIVVR